MKGGQRGVRGVEGKRRGAGGEREFVEKNKSKKRRDWNEGKGDEVKGSSVGQEVYRVLMVRRGRRLRRVK